MKISIVVPAYNEERLLADSLRCIRSASVAFNSLGWITQLIVCDNNSTDRTAEIAAAAGARVVFEPVNQIGRARNTGAAHATGEWIIFVDADSYPTADLFMDVANAIQSGSCIAGGSTVRFAAYRGVLSHAIVLWNCISRITRLAAGSFIFCQASVFRAEGGFSHDLYASEEIDLFKRLKRAAKAHGKGIVILHRNPLLTSDRKIQFYNLRDFLRFTKKVMLTRGRALRNVDDCKAWYDGRR